MISELFDKITKPKLIEKDKDFVRLQHQLSHGEVENLKKKYNADEVSFLLSRETEVKAENILLKKENKDLKDMEKKQLEEDMISFLQEHSDKEKIDMFERSMFIPFFIPHKNKKYPFKVVVLDSKSQKFKGSDGFFYPYLRGVVLEETDFSTDKGVGPFIHLIIGRHWKHKDARVKTIPLGYPFQIKHLISNFMNIVTSMKNTGMLNLTLDNKGRQPPSSITIPADVVVEEFNDGIRDMMNIDVMQLHNEGHISDVVLKLIHGMYHQLNEKDGQVQQAMIAQRAEVAKRMRIEMALRSIQPIIHSTPHLLEMVQKKCDKLTENVMMQRTDMEANNQQRMMHEMLTTHLLSNIEELSKKLGKSWTSTDSEKAMEHIKNISKEQMEIFKGTKDSLTDMLGIPEPEPSPPKAYQEAPQKPEEAKV